MAKVDATEKKTKGRSKKVIAEKEIQEATIEETQKATTEEIGNLDHTTISDEDQPDVAENERIKRYDIILTSERAGYRPPNVAVSAMVQLLAFRGFAVPYEEAIAQTWTEIYFKPGVAAHDIFMDKGYDSDVEIFKELCFRFSEKPYTIEYSNTPKRPLYWSMEIRGARFKNVYGSFKKHFLDALSLKLAESSRPFESLPPHLEVPEDEAPLEKKKRERGPGLAGSAVEEI